MRRRYALTLEKAPEAERDRFRAIEAPETYFEIKKGAPGERVSYSVELTEDEYARALRDAGDPRVNLIHVESVVRTPYPSTPQVPGAAIEAYLGASGAGAMDGAGVDVGVCDSGITPWEKSNIFGGRIKAAKSFVGLDPFNDPNGHGSWMVPIAVPPASRLALAQCGNAEGTGPDEVAAGLNWLADEVGVDVACLESQSNGTYLILDDAVASAAAKGILVIAPAGNGGTDFAGEGQNIEGSPAGSPGAYTVTNYDHTTDSKAPSSRYGNFVWAASCGSPNVAVYTPSGGVDALPDGGTSTGVAAATDLVARTMGMGLGPAQTIAALESHARGAGGPAAHEGIGVLQLPVGVEPPSPEWWWFPGDLPYYITRWPVPEGAEARMTATVIDGADATLVPVVSDDHSELLAGNWRRFAPAIDCSQRGFYKTGWRVARSGDVYVGIVVRAQSVEVLQGLVVGLAEVQIR